MFSSAFYFNQRVRFTLNQQTTSAVISGRLSSITQSKKEVNSMVKQICIATVLLLVTSGCTIAEEEPCEGMVSSGVEGFFENLFLHRNCDSGLICYNYGGGQTGGRCIPEKNAWCGEDWKKGYNKWAKAWDGSPEMVCCGGANVHGEERGLRLRKKVWSCE